MSVVPGLVAVGFVVMASSILLPLSPPLSKAYDGPMAK